MARSRARPRRCAPNRQHSPETRSCPCGENGGAVQLASNPRLSRYGDNGLKAGYAAAPGAVNRRRQHLRPRVPNVDGADPAPAGPRDCHPELTSAGATADPLVANRIEAGHAVPAGPAMVRNPVPAPTEPLQGVRNQKSPTGQVGLSR